MPPQVQFHGPVPDGVLGEPTEHSSLVSVGTVDLVVLLAVPHAPATAGGGGGGGGGEGVAVFCAVQLAVAPPLVPLHAQFQGPLPVTPVDDPTAHSSLASVGRVDRVVPLAVPHTPGAAGGGGGGGGGGAGGGGEAVAQDNDA